MQERSIMKLQQKIYSYKSFFLLLFLLFSWSIQADTFPSRPNPPRLVNDFAGVFNSSQLDNLERALVQFNNETSTQVAVVTVSDLNGYAASDFTFRLAERWGVGQKGKNNGILILIKPKTSTSNGQAFIATGYGLEGAVPDAAARRIVQNEMIPHFKLNNYFDGVVAGINVIMQLTHGEYTADAYVQKTSGGSAAAAFFVILIIFIVAFVITNRANKAKNSSIGSDLPFWLLLSMLSSGSSRRHTGHWGNFNSGGGSFRGGGGFGGFGGGSFGGGGAGGSW